MLTSAELADEVKKSVWWVTTSAASGLIPAHKIGGEWRFVLADVLAATSNRRPVEVPRPRKRRAA